MTEPDIDILESRSAEGSLELELEAREVRKSQDKRDGFDTCREKLLEDADTIKILERLTGRGPTLVDDAVDILTTPQTNRDQKVYQLFLHDILRHSSPGFVLLCAASLGKQRIVHLPERERTCLIGYLKNNKVELHSRSLESLAEAYEVPSVNDARLAHIGQGSKKRVREDEPASLSSKSNRLRRGVVTDAATGPATQPVSERQCHWEVKATDSAIRISGNGYDLQPNSARTVLPESATGLTGDAYELTPEDAPAIIAEIRGQIWLTDPYDANTHQPFVTIPISWQLRDQFILQRPRMI